MTKTKYEIREERITSRQLKPGQRKSMMRMYRFIKRHEARDGVTSLRFKIQRLGEDGMASVTMITRRSDCHKASPRALICEYRIHFMLGVRGGVDLLSISSGLRSDRLSYFQFIENCLGHVNTPRWVRKNLKRGKQS